MATKFTSLEGKKKSKKTVFHKLIDDGFNTVNLEETILEWDNVLHIGKDPGYGDVFKCWDNGNDDFLLYFGEKGDEFD